MPLLYGEGNRAFLRLQEHIIAKTSDHSLFAWAGWESLFGPSCTKTMTRRPRDLLASSPRSFAYSKNVITWHGDHGPLYYRLTNRGLEADLYFPADVDCFGTTHIKRTRAILQCRRDDDFSYAIVLFLSEPHCGIQTVLSDDSRCFDIRKLQAGSISEPIRTTIALYPRPVDANLQRLQTIAGRQLIVECQQSVGLEIQGVTSLHRWNAYTLVLTPLFKPSNGVCSAALMLRNRSHDCKLDLEYGYNTWEQPGRLLVTRTDDHACAATSQKMPVPTNIDKHRSGSAISLSSAYDDHLICWLRPCIRLGHEVVVLALWRRTGYMRCNDAGDILASYNVAFPHDTLDNAND